MTPAQLKAWRKRVRLSQVGLAKLIHHTTQAVYQWESGRRKIPGFLDVLLPLVTHAHAAQFQVNRTRRKQRKEHA